MDTLLYFCDFRGPPKPSLRTPRLRTYALVQRCPTVFSRSPQLWRVNISIRHIFKDTTKSPLDLDL